MFLPAYTRMFLDMHKQRPIYGTILTIGRQTVPFTMEEAIAFLENEGIKASRSVRFRHDTTVAGKPEWINDEVFFALFCHAQVMSLDVSNYERATIIHDMNEPVPRKLLGIADFIFEGSSIDNIFNPAQAIMNIDLMLKPNGRLFMVNAANVVPGDTFVALGEEWYDGFLKTNGYGNISVETWAYDNVDDPAWRKGRDGKSCCVIVKGTKPRTRLHRQPKQPQQHGYYIQHHPIRTAMGNVGPQVVAMVRRAVVRSTPRALRQWAKSLIASGRNGKSPVQGGIPGTSRG